MAIITSMLDTDFYKYSMMNVVFKKFPDVEVEYEFKNRTKGIKLGYDKYAGKILQEVYSMESLRFTDDDIKYLKSLELFSKGYLEFLKRYKFDSNNIRLSGDGDDNLFIKIKGTWLNTILWEVPLLAIISELYSKSYCKDINNILMYVDSEDKLQHKISRLHLYNRFKEGLRFADFGTRRRYSKAWQECIVRILSKRVDTHNLHYEEIPYFVGTSNVYLAKKYNIKPIGTMAHEYIQAMQALVRLKDSQKYAFQTWADVYRGNLGIALSDTLGMDAFYKDFDMYFSKLFDGARHDSGSPDVWCDKLIEHYISMSIDPMTKTAVFSDGLTFPEMIRLHKKYSSRIKVSFGIGTNLTNDCGIKPLQIVIKMTRCNGQPVAKISDSKGKQMCNDKEYLKYLATQFDIRKDAI